jgi:hypothetical protein
MSLCLPKISHGVTWDRTLATWCNASDKPSEPAHGVSERQKLPKNHFNIQLEQSSKLSHLYEKQSLIVAYGNNRCLFRASHEA